MSEWRSCRGGRTVGFFHGVRSHAAGVFARRRWAKRRMTEGTGSPGSDLRCQRIDAWASKRTRAFAPNCRMPANLNCVVRPDRWGYEGQRALRGQARRPPRRCIDRIASREPDFRAHRALDGASSRPVRGRPRSHAAPLDRSGRNDKPGTRRTSFAIGRDGSPAGSLKVARSDWRRVGARDRFAAAMGSPQMSDGSAIPSLATTRTPRILARERRPSPEIALTSGRPRRFRLTRGIQA